MAKYDVKAAMKKINRFETAFTDLVHFFLGEPSILGDVDGAKIKSPEPIDEEDAVFMAALSVLGAMSSDGVVAMTEEDMITVKELSRIKYEMDKFVSAGLMQRDDVHTDKYGGYGYLPTEKGIAFMSNIAKEVK